MQNCNSKFKILGRLLILWFIIPVIVGSLVWIAQNQLFINVRSRAIAEEKEKLQSQVEDIKRHINYIQDHGAEEGFLSYLGVGNPIVDCWPSNTRLLQVVSLFFFFFSLFFIIPVLFLHKRWASKKLKIVFAVGLALFLFAVNIFVVSIGL